MIRVNLVFDEVKRQTNRNKCKLWYASNREYAKRTNTQWRLDNAELMRVKDRERRFGDGANNHFNKQMELQHECCAICGRSFDDTPHFDHNHATSKWRGILCESCNRGLGFFFEDVGVLQKAIAYLQKWEPVCEVTEL